MSYYPITLGIAQKPRDAQISSEAPAEEALSPAVRQKILDRDNHTCRLCGFKSQKYQDILFVDGDSANLQTENLATACIFCHQCFDLEKVAEMRSGVLIWLPEITQAELHHIARAIYVARISQGSMADTAKKALEALMSRREEAKTRLKTDDPHVLAMVMRDFLGPRHYAMRDQKLDGVRLFPLDRRIIKEGDLEFNQFPQILAYWRSKDGPFGGKIPNQWKNFYAQISQAA
ncbi:MAG TPA: type IVB secretion system protein IcmJDotN [Alphaproteobacteria bacterium]|nr:type IVB secretion system protein IcmJDotN [Alphaproteobacteria bacterium]